MARPKLDDVVTRYAETGNCEIDCNSVVKLWGRLWVLFQWKDEFKLVKYLRKDSPITTVKVMISVAQAQELIDRLELEQSQTVIFGSGTSWRSKST